MVIIIGIFVIVPINRIHVKNAKIPSKSHNSTIWLVDKPMKTKVESATNQFQCNSFTLRGKVYNVN